MYDMYVCTPEYHMYIHTYIQHIEGHTNQPETAPKFYS